MSWVGAQPVTRKQRPTAPVTSRPVLSISRSVGTTTRVADVKKTMAPAKSSPPKKCVKSNKPSSPKQQVEPVHKSDAYFTVKTHRGKVRRIPLSPVYTSPLFVFSVMWSELLMRSAISYPLWSSVYECQRVECALTSPVRTESGMFVMYCMQCGMSVSAVL